MKYFFPIHLDGGNRGCEGIAKGTSIILGRENTTLIGYCSDKNLDKNLSLDNYYELIEKHKRTFLEKILYKLYILIEHNTSKRSNLMFYQVYHRFLNLMSKNDLMLSTGGDMMCYGNNQAIYTVNYSFSKGIKSVLWGCSIGKENINSEKLEALKKFSFIYARETLTKKVLDEYDIKNVFVFPDPAFFLEPEICNLPKCFKSDEVIGINISNYVLGGFDLSSEFGRELIILFNYILNNTHYNILIIPHVLWHGQDDRIISKKIKDYFNSERIAILNSEDLNYCQIRYVISKCKVFVGGRTHSVISAYSTKVPTIALGYSIKSVGIAHDIGLPEWTVVNSKKGDKNRLVNAFVLMLQKKNAIKDILNSYMMNFADKRADIINKINLELSSL